MLNLITPAQILIRRSDQTILLANDQMAKLSFKSVDDLLGMKIRELIEFPNSEIERIDPIDGKISVIIKTRPESVERNYDIIINKISEIILRITFIGTENSQTGLQSILSNSELLYQLLRITPFFISTIGPDLRIRYVNKLPQGFELDEVINEEIWRFVVKEQIDEYKNLLRQVFNTQLAAQISIDTTKGRQFHQTILPFADTMVTISTDNTIINKMEGDMFDLSKSFSSLLNSSPLGVAILIGDKFVFSNNRFEDFLGEPILDKKINEIEFLVSINFETFLGHNNSNESLLEVEKPGKNRTEYYRIRYNRSEYFNQEAIILHSEDITNFKMIQNEREKLIKKTEESNKLESLGLLAGGIAHDFNNILTSIIVNGSLLQHQLKGGNPDIRDIVEDLLNAADQAKNLTHQLLSYTGRAQISKTVFNLGKQIKSSISMITGRFRSNIQIEMELNETLNIFADVTQINQIMINLVTNAIEAMPNGGKIKIEMNTIEKDLLLDQKYVNNFVLQGKVSNYIHISIQDSGVGISESMLKKIFNPFFTSKITGKGLGLSVVLGVVESYKGGINVVSDQEGTTFNIYLPHLEENSAEHNNNGKTIISAPLKINKVLIVDDDEAILKSLSRILDNIGIDHDLSSDPNQIFELLELHDFDIIIIDLTMPNHNTFETVNKILEENPSQNILLSSGFPYSETENYSSRENIEFLQKPYSHNELVEVLQNFNL